jgi:hypothetical protein
MTLKHLKSNLKRSEVSERDLNHGQLEIPPASFLFLRFNEFFLLMQIDIYKRLDEHGLVFKLVSTLYSNRQSIFDKNELQVCIHLNLTIHAMLCAFFFDMMRI